MMASSWAPMMAAMMLPGAVPAIARRVRDHPGVLAAPAFAGAYLAVWTAAGLAIYELTPLKRRCRERCREDRSGLAFGLHCVGASVGLMAMFIALGVMSVAWMAVVAVLVAAQKLLPPRTAIDVPLALAIVALGLIVAL